MKTKIIIILLLIAGSSFASSKKDQKLILKNLNQLEKGVDLEKLSKIKSNFAIMVKTSPNDWLLSYYAAYTSILTGMNQIENNAKDECFDEALLFIKQAEKLSPNNAEVLALKSWALGMKIGIDPYNRGRTLGPESSVILSTALKLDNNNPRVYYLMGMSSMYTPEEYGGGKDIALSLFETAIEKYKTFHLTSAEMPNWGKKQTIQAIEDCKK